MLRFSVFWLRDSVEKDSLHINTNIYLQAYNYYYTFLVLKKLYYYHFKVSASIKSKTEIFK